MKITRSLIFFLTALLFSTSAHGFCIYNTTESKLRISVYENNTSFFFRQFQATIDPGKSRCCPGDSKYCKGEDLLIFCQRHGNDVHKVGRFDIGNRGWLKIKCTRESEDKPFRGVVVEKQFKKD